MPEMDIKYRGNYILGTLLICAGVCILPLCLVMVIFAVITGWHLGDLIPTVGSVLIFSALPCFFIIIGFRNRKQAQKEYISAIHQVFVWFLYVSMVAVLPFSIYSAGSLWDVLLSPPDPYKGLALFGPIAVIMLAGLYIFLYIVTGTYYYFANMFAHRSHQQSEKIITT